MQVLWSESQESSKEFDVPKEPLENVTTYWVLQNPEELDTPALQQSLINLSTIDAMIAETTDLRSEIVECLKAYSAKLLEITKKLDSIENLERHQK